ncbi:MAG: metalloregulator ArsR/SmtB family transcription factor [Gammaproteobacteria bacterium]|jgi:ArsR family transcriptional regulator|nr:metalloregulator ArsR/SmtB family transcription factor [Gammaproteobacteria bacterium]MBT3723299.1 metalloregulator ArsR/SmtB family transcription factor [Gammaproteobacteria bacterium]MBT4078100.1 metalloregulator ArsR/SmtB family transcription factor [Gammaproteobacteria bacterium]MBT4859271.1 metalloregulator ArsR/SmtB family transcription factor [Gammaproteobacteria bacterium]MBT6552194.1 metalloregulator ArsR/SmtB family transcription factor [Gammaproteobacteria bacterium]
MQPEQVLKALADITRLRIIHLIKEHNELCVCELTEALDIIQPKISRHLAILRKTGLLIDRREGQWIFYSLSSDLTLWVNELINAANMGCKDKEPFDIDSKKLAKLNLLSSFACQSCA